jgi:predicted AlkP superfamily pyrophosphatase or phosphodiesterase
MFAWMALVSNTAAVSPPDRRTQAFPISRRSRQDGSLIVISRDFIVFPIPAVVSQVRNTFVASEDRGKSVPRSYSILSTAYSDHGFVSDAFFWVESLLYGRSVPKMQDLRLKQGVALSGAQKRQRIILIMFAIVAIVFVARFVVQMSAPPPPKFDPSKLNELEQQTLNAIEKESARSKAPDAATPPTEQPR